MRDYGRVHSSFWTSPTTRSLSEDGKALALYLLTSPHTTMIGCFRAPDGYLSEDLGWPIDRVSNGFAELHAKGFATRDDGTKWVLIHKFLKWNSIDGPKQGVGAAKLYNQVPDDCPLKPLLETAIRLHAPNIPPAMLDPIDTQSNGYGEPNRFQEQEQEPEQEQERLPSKAVTLQEEAQQNDADGKVITLARGAA